MAQFAAVALLPVGAITGALYSSTELTPPIIDALQNVTILALVVAVVSGAVQSEMMLRRVDSLTAATRRVAKQDFSVSIPVQGKDELARLQRDFNSMARTLGISLSVQGLLAEMDEAILTKLDVAALIRNALRCMRYVTQAEVVVLGLFETEKIDAMRIFVIRKGERNRIESKKLEISADLKRRIPLVPTQTTEPQSPFPEEYEDLLRKEVGVGHFYSAPISRGSRAWGVMVSCHVAPVELSAEQIKLLGGVANRLIAGFSGAERDQKLHSLAYVDPLTGLPNRIAMQSLLAQELTQAERHKAMAAVLFIDLDRFKQANDSHGHSFGDRLLIQAANRIRNNVREDDVVARIGGDEFTVILPNVKTPREAASAARKLIQSLSRRFEIEGQSIYTGASVGIAMYPDDGTQGPELLKMADTAMYRAKSEGRSRFAFYEEPMNTESKRRSLLDGELRNALVRQELLLHYQPQIDLKTGALCGVEALVRWQHPTRGLLLPRDFIEYAEEIGLIPEIGTWVMTEACRQYMRWLQQGVRVPRVSVNVSNGQLPRSNFVPTVRQLLQSTKIPPDALEIEVTESMLVEGGKPAMEALNQIAAEGVLIAIDDFGTGYSSFSYLKTMPAQVLKLDMSFLVDARLENDAGKIVAAIINMAHALQKEVVAEGIEHVDQLKLLKTLNCERGQGYLFGKAVSAEQISRTFRRIADVGAAAPADEAPADAMPSADPIPPPIAAPLVPVPAAPRTFSAQADEVALAATAPVLPQFVAAPKPAVLPQHQPVREPEVLDAPTVSFGGPETVSIDLLSIQPLPDALPPGAPPSTLPPQPAVTDLPAALPLDLVLAPANQPAAAPLAALWSTPLNADAPTTDQIFDVARLEGDAPSPEDSTKASRSESR